jgi:hypothetical protein
MIRFFTMGRRRPELTRNAFHAGLLTGHAPLVRSCDGFRQHCQNYTQNHVEGEFDLSRGALVANGEPPFDNCSEFWYADIDRILRSFNNDDYFRMLRPDENRWSDADARIAFIGQEYCIWDRSAVENTDALIKVLVLSSFPRAADKDITAVGTYREIISKKYPGFFSRCLRYAENVITGQLDFKNAALAKTNNLPHSGLSQFTFADISAAETAFGCEDGQQLLSSDVFPFCNPVKRIALLARERVIL